MKRIPRILWVSPTPIFPVNAGNRRHVGYLITAAERYASDIDFVLYGWESEAEKFKDKYEKRFRRFGNFPQPKEKRQSRLSYWGVDDWVSDEFLSYMKDFIGAESYDVIVVEYVWMSRVLEIMPGRCVKVIDTHDVFSDRDVLLERQGIEKQWFYTRADEEARGLSRADFVLGITKSDCLFYAGLLTEYAATLPKVLYCGTGIENKAHQRDVGNRASLVFGYLASSNALNKTAANAFFRELSRHGLDKRFVHFDVGGSICQHVSDYPGVEIFRKGYVSDVGEFYRSVDIVIAPMGESTGLKIKCIEALEYKKPLIATRHATNDVPTTNLWHTFCSVELMARYLAGWLKKKEAAAECRSTLLYLQMETERIFSALSSQQQEAEKNVWGNVCALVAQRRGSTVGEGHERLVAPACVAGAHPATVSRMKGTPAVSVIIAAFNTDKYIRRCIDSILTDRLDEIEVIVVNDGSTDSTGEILDEYANKDRRVRVIHQHNCGQGIARNAGIESARGEYLYFVDSDDAIGQDGLYYMYRKSKELALDICSPERPYLAARPLKFISALPGWCCFVRRDVLGSGSGAIRQPAIRSGQDGVFANMVLTRCGRAAVCSEAKYFYEQRENSTFNSLKKDLASIPGLVEEHLSVLRSFYDREGLFDSQTARYLLFLQDETYRWRLAAHLNGFVKRDAERIFLMIKSELAMHWPKVEKEAHIYFQKRFLSIKDSSFEQFMGGG